MIWTLRRSTALKVLYLEALKEASRKHPADRPLVRALVWLMDPPSPPLDTGKREALAPVFPRKFSSHRTSMLCTEQMFNPRVSEGDPDRFRGPLPLLPHAFGIYVSYVSRGRKAVGAWHGAVTPGTVLLRLPPPTESRLHGPLPHTFQELRDILFFSLSPIFSNQKACLAP